MRQNRQHFLHVQFNTDPFSNSETGISVLRRVYTVQPVTPHMQLISLIEPTTLLEEKSWKGICGIPIKFVGTQFTVFMYKLK